MVCMEKMPSKTTSKQGKVTPETIAESKRLKALWLDAKSELDKRGLGTQEKFGIEFDIGNQAAVGFFLNGRTALSAKAAKGFALGLGCEVSDFSPRLAAFLAAPSASSAGAAHAWPLRRWTPEQWNSIDPRDRAVMEDAAMSKLLQLRSERTAHPFSAPEKRQSNGK